MTQYPPYTPGPMGLRPHRGVLVLVFGILGLVMCFIFGICAWVMGSSDLRQMDAGLMDSSGRSLTQAGQILGMISTALALLGFLILIPFMAIGAFLP